MQKMSVHSEEGLFSPDPTIRLYTKTWTPPSGTGVKARLAFVHGFSDHCNAYYNLFPSLATRGIAVYAFDQRGWGRSSPKKEQQGDTGPTSTVLADIRSFLNHVASASDPSASSQTPGSTPLFLMGHSMGGGEVLLLSLVQSYSGGMPPISGLVLESPLVALDPSAQPGMLTVLAGKLASKLLPKHQLVQKLESRYLSRDQQVCRDTDADILCHDTGTLEGLTGMLQRTADLTALANGRTVKGFHLKTDFGTNMNGRESVPIWIGHGSGDRITSCVLSQAIFKKLDVKDKTTKVYEDAYHKLHAEPDGVAEEFSKDVADWILARTGTGRHEGDTDDMKSKL